MARRAGSQPDPRCSSCRRTQRRRLIFRVHQLVSAFRLVFGVSQGSSAEKRTSSRITYRTVGAPSRATGWLFGAQSGVESWISTSTTPLNLNSHDDAHSET